MSTVAEVQASPRELQVAVRFSDRLEEVAAPLPTHSAVRSKRKRMIDMALAGAGLVLLAPFLALMALLIVLDSGWPALYAQRRIGLGGRPFTLWKFRTMVRRAHAMRDELLAFNEGSFPAFKMRRDPRVTRLGRLLRRSSIDELPQLWNVLSGDMSLVGPRPPLPEEVQHYDAFAMGRLAVRPGITCIWQVENRQAIQIAFEEWVRKDLAYIENWSLRRDAVLILRTLHAAAKMNGQ
jgi:lipopolysaccharide/colanic/teichoic acid biosynthesis glycosyltransferase